MSIVSYKPSIWNLWRSTKYAQCDCCGEYEVYKPNAEYELPIGWKKTNEGHVLCPWHASLHLYNKIPLPPPHLRAEPTPEQYELYEWRGVFNELLAIDGDECKPEELRQHITLMLKRIRELEQKVKSNES